MWWGWREINWWKKSIQCGLMSTILIEVRLPPTAFRSHSKNQPVKHITGQFLFLKWKLGIPSNDNYFIQYLSRHHIFDSFHLQFIYRRNKNNYYWCNPNWKCYLCSILFSIFRGINYRCNDKCGRKRSLGSRFLQWRLPPEWQLSIRLVLEEIKTNITNTERPFLNTCGHLAGLYGYG